MVAAFRISINLVLFWVLGWILLVCKNLMLLLLPPARLHVLSE
jgi:hypothetical protein